MKATVKMEGVDAVKLTVTATATISDWKQIVKIIQEGNYYGPAADLRDAVKIAIRNAEQAYEGETF